MKERKQDESIKESNNTGKIRYFNIDLIRVLSCFMVLHYHSGEFYLVSDPSQARVLVKSPGLFWHTILNGLFRPCVPLFVMISGYLLLPIKTEFFTFLKTRMTRVVFPFIFWCVFFSFYNFILGKYDIYTAIINALKTFVNYGVDYGHLWYMYMIIGIYMFIPIISPWTKEATKGQFIYFFIIWLLSSLLFYIHMIFPAVWGECFWNASPMLYYFTGYIGYVILGCYIKRFLQGKNLFFIGLIMYITGYLVNIFSFLHFTNINASHEVLDASWGFTSFQTIIQSLRFFFMFKNINCNNKIIKSIISELAEKSFGMYLLHMIYVQFFIKHFDAIHSNNPPLTIESIAFLTFICSYLTAKILSYLPFYHYILG